MRYWSDKKLFNMASKHSRRAKIQRKYRYLSSGMRRVPELRISGVWLADQGFDEGSYVDIEASMGRLIITRRWHGRG